MSITITTDSATISTTEYGLASDSTSITYQTDDCDLTVLVRIASMAAGDQFRLRLYEKVNGGTAEVVWESIVTGVQPGPIVMPRLVVGEGWEATVQKLAGTDRTVHWSLRKIKTDWNEVLESTITAGDIQRILLAAVSNKGTVNEFDGSYAFRDVADTKDRIAGSIAVGGARTITTRDGT